MRLKDGSSIVTLVPFKTLRCSLADAGGLSPLLHAAMSPRRQPLHTFQTGWHYCDIQTAPSHTPSDTLGDCNMSLRHADSNLPRCIEVPVFCDVSSLLTSSHKAGCDYFPSAGAPRV